MAGAVRQPIDVQSLERYISKHVPEIRVPIDVKQVGFICYPPPPNNSDMPIVRFRTVEPHIPTDSKRWAEIRYAQEATRKIALEDSA
jgi:hypothetical protein